MMQSAPALCPAARADAPGGCALMPFQQAAQGRMDGHSAAAAGFAVPRFNGDGFVFQVDLCPGQPLDFVRADPGVEHESHGRKAAAVVVFFGGFEELLDFGGGEDGDGLLDHTGAFDQLYRVPAAPAAPPRGAEDGAEDGFGLHKLSRGVEGGMKVLGAFLRGDAADAPLRQPRAALHQTAADVAEVGEGSCSAIFASFQSFRDGSFKADGLFTLAQSVRSEADALFRPTDPAARGPERFFCHQSGFQNSDISRAQHLQGCPLFLRNNCAHEVRF